MRSLILFFFGLLIMLPAAMAQAPCPAGTCTSPPSCNLVCNGDFELCNSFPTNTPSGPGQIPLACPWGSGNGASPDYYNTGATGAFDVPVNFVGTEVSFGGGDGYAGVCSFNAASTTTREYLHAPLRCQLLAGVTYMLTYRVSLAEDSRYDGQISAAVCSPFTPPATLTAVTPPAGAYILNAGIVNNTGGWTTITGTFTATGNETDILIGNFNTAMPIVTINPHYTYNGAYVYIDGITLEPVQNLTVSAPHVVCAGAPFQLTNNYGLPIDWSAPSWSCIGCISPTTSVTTNTMFTGTITYCTGCVQTTGLTVVVSPISVSAAASPSTITTTGGTSTLTATATPSAGATYSWLPGGMTGASVTVTPSATTVYTVTATNPDGCTAQATVTVTVVPPPQCTITIPPANDIVGPQTISGVFGAATGATGQNFRITGTLTVDHTFNFSGCNIIMEPNAKIEVQSGSTLYITGQTHIFSCTQMWDGIYALSGSSLQVMNSSFIEHGTKAFHVAQGATGMFEGVIFNQNYTSIELSSNTSATSPVTIRKCVFTCRQIPSGATPSANPLSTAIWADAVSATPANPATNMIPPYSSSKSYYGVYATDVNMMRVGETAAATDFNGFDNLGCGVYLTRSNAAVQNNRFHKMVNGPACLPLPCPSILGIGVYATGTTTGSYNVLVGGAGTNQGNMFRDLYKAIDINNYKITKVLKNTINVSSTIIPPTVYGIGMNGIVIKPAYDNTIQVEDNTILNCITGIWINRNNSNSISTSSLKINRNNPITANASGYCTNGIYVQDWSAGTTMTPVTSEIQDNVITECANGIYLLNAKKFINVKANSITVRYASSGALSGIKAAGCQYTQIENNHTKYNNVGGTAYTSGSNILAYGIHLQSSTDMLVKCNLADDAARSLVFEGNCTSPLQLTTFPYSGVTRNTMNRAQDGLVIRKLGIVPGAIGTQGSSTVASNNEWTGTFANSHTLMDQSDANNSILYLTTGSPTYPTINHVISPGVAYSGSTLIPSSGSSTVCGYVPLAPMKNESRSTGVNARMSSDSEAGTGHMLYPNPTNGSFTIAFDDEQQKNVQVCDVMGKIVYEQRGTTEQIIVIDLSKEAKGVYIIKVTSEGMITTSKIIRQ